MDDRKDIQRIAADQDDVGGLRGDIGASFQDHDGVDLFPALAGTRTISSSLAHTPYIAVGAGYAFNSWFRTDATLEYRIASKFKITEETAGAPPGYNVATGKLSGIVGLANAYVDLGTWHRITPFVGLGVGFASMTMSDVRDSGYGAFAGGSGRASDKTTTRFAWALHAGLGFDLTANLKAEMAYRYLHVGTVDSATIACTVPCGPFNARIKDLASHDLKVGIRYMFADAPAPAYAPGPLVRKY